MFKIHLNKYPTITRWITQVLYSPTARILYALIAFRIRIDNQWTFGFGVAVVATGIQTSTDRMTAAMRWLTLKTTRHATVARWGRWRSTTSGNTSVSFVVVSLPPSRVARGGLRSRDLDWRGVCSFANRINAIERRNSIFHFHVNPYHRGVLLPSPSWIGGTTETGGRSSHDLPLCWAKVQSWGESFSATENAYKW